MENNAAPFTMPVAPAYGGGYGGFGGGFGGDWAWIIILLLCGWGGMGMGGFGGGYGNMALSYDFPWLLNGQNNLGNNVSGGFRDAMLNDSINAIGDKINGIGTQLYTNQISDLERSFAAQTASMQGMNAIQAQLAQCCCDNRAATADLKYTLATEACATRSANAANTQMVMDKLCQLELDGYKRENDNLRTQLNMATLAASQNAQTATIQAGQRALANEVEQYVLPTPRPAYVVANPNCCQPYGGCGCGVA